MPKKGTKSNGKALGEMEERLPKKKETDGGIESK